MEKKKQRRDVIKMVLFTSLWIIFAVALYHIVKR
jgi:hypothetical protein